MRLGLPLLALGAVSLAAAPPSPSPAEIARAHLRAHEPEILREFAELLSLPNVATDTPNIRKNAEHIRGMLERRGLKVELLDGAGPPAVYAEKRGAGAKRTLVIYAH